MTLCLNPQPIIPSGLLSDPYFQSEVFGEINVAAVITTAAEFIQQLADALKNFGMAMLGAFKEAMDAVAEAVNKVVELIKSLVEALVDMAKQLFSPVINKIKEMMQGIYDYLKDQFEALSSILSGGDGDFTLLQDILNLPYLRYFLILPTIISAIYYIVSASSMGVGTIVLSVLTVVLPMAISAAMGASQNPMNIPVDTEDLIRIAWEKGLGIQDTTELTGEEKIAIVSSFAGFTASKIAMTILEETKGASIETQKELELVRTLVEEMAMVLRWPGGYDSWNEYETAEKEYAARCNQHKELVEKQNEFDEVLTGYGMAKLGFAFSLFSLVVALFPALIDNIPEQLKPVLFGLSVGIGVGGLLASLTGLKTIDRGLAFLSEIGIASSLIGMVVSIYEVSKY